MPGSKLIFVVEDEPLMAECITRAAKKANSSVSVKVFGDAYMVMDNLQDGLPDLIFLDVLLAGPNGFTLLNELASYSDTAKIPIVVVSSLDLTGKDLSEYGIVKIFNKETMLPSDIGNVINEVLSNAA